MDKEQEIITVVRNLPFEKWSRARMGAWTCEINNEWVMLAAGVNGYYYYFKIQGHIFRCQEAEDLYLLLEGNNFFLNSMKDECNGNSTINSIHSKLCNNGK